MKYLPYIVIGIILGLTIFFTVRYFTTPTAKSVSKDYNCSDFKTRIEAQSYLLPGDPYHLDANHNQIACDSLPAR